MEGRVQRSYITLVLPIYANIKKLSAKITSVCNYTYLIYIYMYMYVLIFVLKYETIYSLLVHVYIVVIETRQGS